MEFLDTSSIFAEIMSARDPNSFAMVKRKSLLRVGEGLRRGGRSYKAFGLLGAFGEDPEIRVSQKRAHTVQNIGR